MKPQGASVMLCLLCLLTTTWGSTQQASPSEAHQPPSVPAEKPDSAQGSPVTPSAAMPPPAPTQPSSVSAPAEPIHDTAAVPREQPQASATEAVSSSPIPAENQSGVVTQPQRGGDVALSPEPDHEIATWVPLFRLGLVATGLANDTLSCEGVDCPGAGSGSEGYVYRPALAMGAELFWQLTPLLRLGPGLLFTRKNDLKFRDAPNGVNPVTDLGSILSAGLALELTPRLSRKFWLVPRIQLGLAVLFPEGDFEDYTSLLREDCQASGTLEGCASLEGPHLGANASVGIGGMFLVRNTVRLRIDAQLEAHSIRLATIEAPGANATLTENLNGVRLILLGGIEF